MSSILTNVNAMSALQTLRSISNNMEDTQSRISSGLRVGTASDNAAYWSIATTMKSDNATLSSVQDAIGLGAAKVDTAYAGMESALEVVDAIKNKLLTAQESTADKSKLQEEIKQLQGQLNSIASSASFSGENFLKANLGGDAESLKKSVVGGFTRDSSGNVKVQTIEMQLSSSTVLFDTNTKAGAAKAGILDATLKLDEKRATLQITTAKPVTTTGEDLVNGNSVKSADTAGNEVYTTSGGDTYVRYNDTKGQVRDAAGKDLWVQVVARDATDPDVVPAAPNNVTAKAADGTTALEDGAATSLTYYVVTKPVVETKTVAATTESALTAASSTATLDGTYDPATGAIGTPSAADVAKITAKDFMKVEIATNGVATVYSDYKTDGTAGKTETYIKLGASDTWVKATANPVTGTPAVSPEYKDGVKGVKVNSTTPGADPTYYTIDTANQSIASAFGNVNTDAGFSVTDLDITKLGDLSGKLGLTEDEVLGKMVQFVVDQYKTMTSAAAELGSVSMRIGLQENFVSKLSDTLEKGIGRLVDADMNEESTRLKALQTQQQLAVQALSIANSDSQNILSLFR
jgi:flagellin-like hook-associated protein FlgL